MLIGKKEFWCGWLKLDILILSGFCNGFLQDVQFWELKVKNCQFVWFPMWNVCLLGVFFMYA